LIKYSRNINKTFQGVLAGVAKGTLAGVVSLAVVYPLDYANLIWSTDMRKSGSFTSLWNVITRTVASYGFAALYTGFGITLVGHFMYRYSYFFMYDILHLILQTHLQNAYVKFAIGQASCLFGLCLTYPLDSLRHRMMVRAGAGRNSSMKSVVGEILAKEDSLSLYSGFGLRLLECLVGLLVLRAVDRFIR